MLPLFGTVRRSNDGETRAPEVTVQCSVFIAQYHSRWTHHFADLLGDAAQVLVVDGLLDEETSGGDAVLALVEEHAAHTL